MNPVPPSHNRISLDLSWIYWSLRLTRSGGSLSNPRKGSYGYLLRISTGIDMTDFTGASGRNIQVKCSASSSGGFALDFNASTLFIGQSTIYSSSEGLTFTSAQWVYGQNMTAQAFSTADDYNVWVEASATGKYFISPVAVITVDD